MLEIPFLAGEMCFTACWLLVRACLWLKRGRIDWKREALLLLMFVNLAVIIRFTFYPMDRSGGRVLPLVFSKSRLLPLRINLVPFVNMFHHAAGRDILLNVIGNAAMFIPTGIVLPIVYKRLNSFWKVVLTGALISLAIELLQLLFFERVTDIDDLMLNTLGAAAGYGIYSLFRRICRISGKSAR